MRLDKYLKVARVIKRRTIAKDILDLGFVKINNRYWANFLYVLRNFI